MTADRRLLYHLEGLRRLVGITDMISSFPMLPKEVGDTW